MDKLFNILKNGVGHLFLDGQKNCIYPFYAPEGKIPNNTLIYNFTNQAINYNQISAEIQLTVACKSYQDMIDRINAITALFNSKHGTHNETVPFYQSSIIRNIVSLSYDEENQLYLTAINIFIKDRSNDIL